jgi:hypothetical protein
MSNNTTPFINNNLKLSTATIGASIIPVFDNTSSLGNNTTRYSDFFAIQTTIGAFFESGLKTEGIGGNPTGTIVSWRNGKLIPSSIDCDEMVMGVIKHGKDEPIIFGAEYILITGEIEEGDYIITSTKIGHGRGIKRSGLFKKDLFGKVIAQALESSSKCESVLIKSMIRKM